MSSNSEFYVPFGLYWLTVCYRFAQAEAMSLFSLKRNGSSYTAAKQTPVLRV